MPQSKGVSKQFWAEAPAAATYARNRVTSRALEANKTPHHIWHAQPPNLSRLRVFRCRCVMTFVIFLAALHPFIVILLTV